MARDVIDRARVDAFVGRVVDLSLTDRERGEALTHLRAALPSCELFLVPDAHGDSCLAVYVKDSEFDRLPTRVRALAHYIEEVRKDGSGIVYKTRTGGTGPLKKTTLPGYKPPRPTAWAHILDDDD